MCLTGHCYVVAKALWEVFFFFLFCMFLVLGGCLLAKVLKKKSGPYIWLWALSQCKSMGFLGPLYCPPVINLTAYEINSKHSPQKYTYKHSIMLGCFAWQESLKFYNLLM